jgi:hypothetical protein
MTEGYRTMTIDDYPPDKATVLLDPRREDVLQSIQFGMQFRRGKASNAAREVAATALAEMVLEHLELCGYVIKQRPPKAGHSTPPSGYKAHLTD